MISVPPVLRRSATWSPRVLVAHCCLHWRRARLRGRSHHSSSDRCAPPSASRRIGLVCAAAVRTRNSYRCSANWSGTIRRAATRTVPAGPKRRTRAQLALAVLQWSPFALCENVRLQRAHFRIIRCQHLAAYRVLDAPVDHVAQQRHSAQLWLKLGVGFRDACWPRAGGTCRRTRRSRFRVHRRLWNTLEPYTAVFYRFRFSKPAHPGASRAP